MEWGAVSEMQVNFLAWGGGGAGLRKGESKVILNQTKRDPLKTLQGFTYSATSAVRAVVARVPSSLPRRPPPCSGPPACWLRLIFYELVLGRRPWVWGGVGIVQIGVASAPQLPLSCPSCGSGTNIKVTSPSSNISNIFLFFVTMQLEMHF